MKLKQESKVLLCTQGGDRKRISIEELEDALGFSYSRQISFQTPELKTLLQKKGKELEENSEIDPSHLELGEKWREEILTTAIPPVSVRWIDAQIEYGLFAEEEIEIGAFAGEYIGQIRKNNNRLFISNYLYAYPLCDEIGRNYVIDATAGSLIRFINHSYKPNLVPHYAYFDGFYHMILLAIAPIKKGEQLTYNYGKNYWYVRIPPKEFS